jgi:hypothetical protein
VQHGRHFRSGRVAPRVKDIVRLAAYYAAVAKALHGAFRVIRYLRVIREGNELPGRGELFIGVFGVARYYGRQILPGYFRVRRELIIANAADYTGLFRPFDIGSGKPLPLAAMNVLTKHHFAYPTQQENIKRSPLFIHLVLFPVYCRLSVDLPHASSLPKSR